MTVKPAAKSKTAPKGLCPSFHLADNPSNTSDKPIAISKTKDNSILSLISEIINSGRRATRRDVNIFDREEILEGF